MNQLKIQTVLGLIRKSTVQDKSHKYSSKGVRHSNIRSTGIYAEKTHKGIVVSFWNGHGIKEQSAVAQLNQFVEFATANGFKLTQQNKFDYLIELAK